MAASGACCEIQRAPSEGKLKSYPPGSPERAFAPGGPGDLGEPKRMPKPDSYSWLQDLNGQGLGYGGLGEISRELEQISRRLVAIEKLQQDQVEMQAGHGIQKMLEDHTERMLQAWVEVLGGNTDITASSLGGHALQALARSPRILNVQSDPLVPDSGRSINARSSLTMRQRTDKIQEELHRAMKKDKGAVKFFRGSSAQLPDVTGPSSAARLIVHHPLFEAVSAVLIILNAGLIGIELDWSLQYPRSGVHIAFKVLNIVFVVAFSLELAFRATADKLYFFSRQNHSFYWNIFDTVLVATSILEEALSTLSNVNVSVVRLLRSLRLVRSFRIIRLFKAFRDLRVMLAGILQSLRSLVWAGLLLLSIMYLTAVILLQFTGEEMHLQLTDPRTAALDQSTYDELIQLYGSLPLTIYTLYKSICGGIDWGDAAQSLFALSMPVGLLFLAFVSFAILCVLNIITGVFVENANRLTTHDEEMVLMEQMELRKKWFSEVEAIFKEADVHNTGCIHRDHFGQQMEENPRLQACLRKLGLQVEAFSWDGLFTLLDFDGDGRMDLDEFILALASCHGNARAIDMAKLARDTRVLRKEMKQALKMIKAALPDGKSAGGNGH
eukprot:TRINITY_DN12349_c0_g1_i1.p1 TRINITY_DN12349_c0_g1~~TRINITY_DN12349_c0_g1_i1.p1  ORF type:complete len:611 (-),score=105.18 TRINITY_DN12349_c0_g1_i1:60-1892(-)